ncbi:probable peroxidase 61 [Asparagus officinalis]|uniref:probable peroxidase 61 n=1 Tax=Asparagus officinalis TaxID=4686 RepID=UPI00098E86F4|nr:probable peroxidase 61 [Asparagus officinalis]
MNPSLVAELRKTCTPNTTGSRISNETVYLNSTSGNNNHSFQSSYFDHVLKNRDILRIDQQMITTMDGIRIAHEFANEFEDFKRYFVLGMARLGSLGVLTRKEGEIRNSCRRTNSGKVLK